MNLSDSKKKLALAGVVCGIVAACLAALGNPANMAFCIACFIRDTAGAMGLHQAEVVQYARPEIIGLVLGSIYHFCGNKRISLNSRIISDDSFCTWCNHYDRCTGIPWMSAPYGAPYVSR